MTVVDQPVDRDVVADADADGASWATGPGRRWNFRPGVTLAWVWIAVLVFAALTAQWLPIKAYSTSFELPLHKSPSFSLHEPFGSDQLGRSILSRVIYGGRVTLAVGIISTLLGMVIGGVLGLVGGYLGKRVDYVLTTLTDAMLAFPPIVFLLTLRAVLVNPEAGRQFTITQLVLILAVLTIPSFYRQTRAQVIAIRDREFVTLAEALGARRWWILFRELLPNVIMPVASIGFIVMAGLMVAEGSLSLLGFGMPEPQPSWGKMIFDGKQNLQLGEHLHEMVIPMIVLVLTVFSLNVVGEAARTRFDPRASRL